MENALLCMFGIVFGVTAAYAVNLCLLNYYDVGKSRTIIVLALGQAAALFPALRASRITPTQALRSI
jgi:putative ABC transport system permease protein